MYSSFQLQVKGTYVHLEALIAVHYAYRLISFAGKYSRPRSLEKPWSFPIETYDVGTPYVARIDHLAQFSIFIT